uniref:endopeptidase La n=2 Tax=Candidatus Bipolaricaulota TaxID=67810 RepID=H5SMK3_9BACT|nr:ATP-dependent protease [uncultured Acetothermia bacterium]BAL58905.1 ATP-dependent protease [Candidatus Acetothermum autotrophicum]
MARRLQPEELRRRCDPEIFGVETTAECAPLDDVIGQERALRALELGLGIKDFRYNIYVAGSPGTGKNSIVQAFLKKLSLKEPAPNDLCYVHNFADPYCPRYILLPPGQGRKLAADMDDLIEKLRERIPAAYHSEEYRKKRQSLDEQFNELRLKVTAHVEHEARQRNFLFQLSVLGFQATPLLDGQPLTEEAFAKLPERERHKIARHREELQEIVQEAMTQLEGIEEQRLKAIAELDRDIALYTIKPLIKRLQTRYGSYPRVLEFLEDVEADILQNIKEFAEPSPQSPTGEGQGVPLPTGMIDLFTRYKVNVLVDHSKTKGAPVVVEENATYTNLFGKIERRVQFGVMTADFTMIKPGSLHQANGGYLVLNADNLLKYWISWEALKIALRCGRIQIEDPATMMGFTTTEGLKPEPVPLSVKVILIGSPELYYLLETADEDFAKLFAVKADFDDEMSWEERYVKQLGPFVAARVRERPGLKHFHKTALARLAEYAAELTGDQKKLSARFSDLMTIVREASYWAERDGARAVKAEHVEKAIEEKTYRNSLIEEKIHELILRGDILVDLSGERVGCVNGLSVLQLPDISFGRPTRITANVFTGKEGVLDVEREAELSGKLHSKGVLILKGWLGEKFAVARPLSLSASITFEQSYSKIDGDSASSTELYALISALAQVPLKQGIAVTGSVNQKGEIQPIGSVNEKIDGFFKVCKAHGLTGEQGVIIPEQNIDNLMLRQEIIDAVQKKQFHIYAVKTVEEGLEILTGLKAGERGPDGTFPEGTIYARVEARLREIQKNLNQTEAEEEEEKKT